VALPTPTPSTDCPKFIRSNPNVNTLFQLLFRNGKEGEGRVKDLVVRIRIDASGRSDRNGRYGRNDTNDRIGGKVTKGTRVTNDRLGRFGRFGLARCCVKSIDRNGTYGRVGSFGKQDRLVRHDRPGGDASF